MGSLGGLIAIGLWLLNPLFRLLAAAGAREVMTAAALLVVLGAAQLMVVGGLSMALGAFLAGVLLSRSSFRHQLEADVEPFRGLLLGLFFVAVGMSLDLSLVQREWALLLVGVLALMLAKGACVWIAARLTGSPWREAVDRAVLMAQGGEFAFVLYSAALGVGVLDATTAARLNAIIVLSMALTPLFVVLAKRLVPKPAATLDGVPMAEGLSGNVLLIGFGRFGQVVSQSLLARGVQVSIIDTDIEMIDGARELGFKVYYGDGSRLDVLHASGAGAARVIAICVDKKEAVNKIVAIAHHSFPQAKLLARTFDREHALQLVGSGVEYTIRETFESALRFGTAALEALGVAPEEATEIGEAVRRRDADRFALEIVGGSYRAGIGLMLRNVEHGEGHAEGAAPAAAAITPAPAAPTS